MSDKAREILLIDDPRVLAVPIEECGESLVDLRDYPLLVSDEHPGVSSPVRTRLFCREGVAERLVKADTSLPDGTRLLVLECHRPLELQTRYWEADLRRGTPVLHAGRRLKTTGVRR